MDIQNTEARGDDWLIPWWVKMTVTVFACSVSIILVLAVLSAQEILFGLSTGWIGAISAGLVLLSIAEVVAVWFFPSHPLTLFSYWLIRFLRDQIWLFSLLGIVALLTVRVPVFSVRGGIPLINLLLLFFTGLFLQPANLDDSPVLWMKNLSDRWEKWINKLNSVPAWIPTLVVALLPTLIICSIIYFGLHSRLSDYGPYSFWNDETGYWVWIRSFSQAGFNVGYNAPNELIAQAPFNHYGEGSPFYIYIYGTIARLVGWSPQLPLLINFVLLGLVIVVFIRATKLGPVQILFVGLTTILTWPILLYLPMTTHETLNQAIGFILAIIFFSFLTNREQVSLPTRISSVVLIYLAALIRLSWGLLLVPVIFYSLNGSVSRRVLLSLLLGFGLFLSAILVTNYLVPPINNSILVNIEGSLFEGPQILIKYIFNQFRLMFKFRELNPNIAVMLQIAIILVWGVVRLIRLIQAKYPISTILQSRTLFDMYNVGSLAAGGLLFYIHEGFYRTFAPSLLIVYLLQTTRRDYRPLITLLTVSLVFFYPYMTFYAHVGDAAIIRSDFTTKFSERIQLQSEIENWIAFDKTAQNPWCNTVLIPLRYYDSRLIAIPAGIGISYVQDSDEIQMPIKSKYLLLDGETYDVFASRLNATLLKSLSIGDLYYNLDSGCELK